MSDFLFEIGLEEVPARMLAAAEAELARRTMDLLGRERLLGEVHSFEAYSSPRRLAVLVRGVLPQQSDVEEELLGPPLKAAYKDGKPTAAADAFAKKAGVSIEALRTVTNPKGEYLAATAKRAGRSFAEIIVAELPKEVAAIYWAKNMYWRAGKPERFVRPVQWLTCLLDSEVIPFQWGGRAAGRLTYGHRVLHGSAAVSIEKASEYAEKLYGAKVIVKVEDRRHLIRKALDAVTRTAPTMRWREDHALVDKVTHMTEWPSVILGTFEREFLPLPEEVLVTVMRDHQNYFAVEDSAGKLAPHFLAVLNTQPDPGAEYIIRHGNERVLRARFNDARFFFEFDQRTPLAERVALLENVTFQKDLGSYAAKTERVRAVAAALGAAVREAWLTRPATAELVSTLDLSALDTAARLAKTDLTTEMVKEFTELQGVIGGLYARVQGHGEAVAQAIYAHYQPVGMDDAIPATTEGLLLAIADKIDSIAGMFGLGLQPTGSKDPFALRRAANGIVKMLAESDVPLSLGMLATVATGDDQALCTNVKAFLSERLEWYLREVRGNAYDVVKAVMAANPEDVRDAVARVEAVSAARDGEDFAAIAAAFKRMKNLVEQAHAKGESFAAGSQLELLTEPAERRLAEESGRRAASVEGLRRDGHYSLALSTTAEMRPFVDDFFDKVMVMAPEQSLREARLGLLQRVLNDFSRIADFSEIVVAG
ncbi:MAG: glycine--tRNA ligase subunit beta [Janthinobacterium lividum]